ncbi:TonB-dependent receptor [Parasphingorhabdus sp.]|uniref:TonB-dependent receptor n=1 Tax=Parasphingorhabdus sp. TaxID=2709688 RepID=UPI003A8D3BC6
MKYLFFSSALAVAISSPAVAQDTVQDMGTETAASRSDSETIVVTATRREQTLQEVPISVAVIGGEQIETSGILLFDDLQASVPNLQIDRTNGNFAITMRGLGAGTGNLSFDQSVGLFLDGVYLSRARSFQNPLLDVERVEVVRGPQGALFGKNTNAGAISVITRKPTRHLEGFARTSGELEHGGWNLEGAVSGPVSDTVSVRLTGRIGAIGDTMYNTLAQRHENGSRYEGVRGQLLWEPSDNFNALVKVEHASNRMDGGALVFNNIGDASCFLCNQVRNSGTNTPEYPSFSRVSNTVNPEYDNTRTTLAQLTMNLTLGDWAFTSVTAYQKLNAGVNSDYDGPLTFLESDITEQSNAVFQEVRAQRDIGDGGSFIAGLTYIDADLHVQQASLFDAASAGLPIPLNGLSRRQFDQSAKSWSPFLSLEVPVSEQIMLSGSLRYSKERRVGRARSQNVGVFPPTYLPFDLTETRPESLWDYSMRARYEFSKSAYVYLSYATGTKGGGFVSNDALLLDNINKGIAKYQYGSERARSWELGGKFRFMDGRGQLNVALFHTNFSDLQVSEYNGTAFITGNAASAISRGVEVDTNIKIGDFWRVGGSLGYVDAHYKDYPGGACLYDAPATCSPVTNNLAGERLTRAPEWSTSGFVEAKYPISSSLYALGHVSATQQSRSYFQPDLDPLNSQSGFVKFDARLAVGHQDGKWELALIGRNLANKVTTTQGFNTPVFGGNSHFALVGAPRTVTVQMSINF